MTSKLVVNTIEADTGISSVSFASSISMSSTSVFHFSDAGVNIGADTNISRLGNGILGFKVNGAEKFRIDSSGHIKAVGVCTATHFYGDGSNLSNLPATTTITVADESTDTTCFPLYATAASGNLAPKTGSNLTFNSSSGNLRSTSLFLGTGSNESKAQDGLIMERNSGDGEVHITAGRSGGNYSGLQFYVAGGSGVTKRHQIDYQSNFKWYSADGTTERIRLTSGGKIGFNYAAAPPSEDIMICTAGQASPAGVSISHLSGGNRYGLRLQSVSGTNAGITFSPFINSSYQDFMRITYDTTTNDGKLGINNLTPSYALDIQHTGANQANAAVSRFRQITDNGGEDHALMLCRHAGARPGSNGVDLLFQNSGGTTVGKIDHGHSTTQYRTSSDYRLKENAVSISDGITRLKTLKPYRFNFIAEPDKIVDGFFAHEAAVAVPEAVSGTKDEVDSDNNPIIQGIDHSKLVPLLTAALQEAISEIESLKKRVTTLEGS